MEKGVRLRKGVRAIDIVYIDPSLTASARCRDELRRRHIGLGPAVP